MRNTTRAVYAAIRVLQAVKGALRVEPNKVPAPALKRGSTGVYRVSVETALAELLEAVMIEEARCLNWNSYGVKDFKTEESMKHFENAIREYLDGRAKADAKFAEKYSDGKKSIEECCRYIISEMRKKAEGGCYGATDAEVYGLAVHYYDEPDLKFEDRGGEAKVVINREPTAEELEEANKAEAEKALKEAEDKARRKAEAEERKRQKEQEKVKAEAERKRKEEEEMWSGTLFDFRGEDER